MQLYCDGHKTRQGKNNNVCLFVCLFFSGGEVFIVTTECRSIVDGVFLDGDEIVDGYLGMELGAFGSR